MFCALFSNHLAVPVLIKVIDSPRRNRAQKPQASAPCLCLMTTVCVLMNSGKMRMSTRFLKASEIAERFRVSRDAVYLWIRLRKSPSECVIRIAGTVRVDEQKFEDLLLSGNLDGRVGRNVRDETVQGADHQIVHLEAEQAADCPPSAPRRVGDGLIGKLR
jgi:hypothetical protein